MSSTTDGFFWDQLGCGCSDQLSDTSLWTMERSLAEVDAVREHLGLGRHHRFGNSSGGMLVQHYCSTAPGSRPRPWRIGLEDCWAGLGMEIYLTMVGPSDFTLTGNLKDWDIFDQLGEMTVPTLFVAGRYDECTPEHMTAMHEAVPGCRTRCSAHGIAGQAGAGSKARPFGAGGART